MANTKKTDISSEEIVVEEVEPAEEDDNLDILRQIQQIKQEVPSSDDEEDEALIEKIKTVNGNRL